MSSLLLTSSSCNNIADIKPWLQTIQSNPNQPTGNSSSKLKYLLLNSKSNWQSLGQNAHTDDDDEDGKDNVKRLKKEWCLFAEENM